MPSPVGHALGGLIAGMLVSERAGSCADRRGLALCAVAACLPDIDFAWGRHNMETHSVGFAIVIGALTLAWTRSRRLAIAAALAVLSHVLFDWLGSDDAAPLGVMALWPFTAEFYFAHANVFAAISRQYWKSGFAAHNVLAILRELGILLPAVALLAYRYRRCGGGPRSSSQSATRTRSRGDDHVWTDRVKSE